MSHARWVLMSVLVGLSSGHDSIQASARFSSEQLTILNRNNLAAWCIVPFDKSQRGPIERAEMLDRLGIRKVAYDWRDRHVPTFEQEILAYKKHDLEFFAFWATHETAFRLFQKYDIHPQIWKTVPSPEGQTQQNRVRAAAAALLPLVDQTRKLGSRLGLYNHGHWGGQPENMVAICQTLRDNHDAAHVGIVYNFHHAHDRIGDFATVMKLIKPYLLCLNLNGMNDHAEPKILPIGQGRHEKQMIEIVLRSGYKGPIGIIDHRNDVDAEESLRQSLDGLALLKRQWKNQQETP